MSSSGHERSDRFGADPWMVGQFSNTSEPAPPVSAVTRPVSISCSGMRSTQRPCASYMLCSGPRWLPRLS